MEKMRLNLNQASAMTGITRQTISKYVRQGKIKNGVVIAGRYSIPKEELQNLIKHF